VEASRAYVLLNKDSYYVIKIAIASDIDLNRLDDILKENSEFACKEGPMGEGLPIELARGEVRVKKIAPSSNGNTSFNLAHFIYDGGKTVRQFMIGTAESIAGGMKKVGGHIEDTYIVEKAEQVPVTPKTMGRLAMLNSATGMVSSMSTFYIKGLMSLSQTIAQKIEMVFEKKKYEKDLDEIKKKEELRSQNIAMDVEEERSGNVALAAVHSAISVFHGMVEALDIITTGFSTTTSGIVSSKYGPLAGEVFKAGVGVVGTAVPSIPGTRYLKYARRL